MAQAMEAPFTWADNKAKLLDAIRSTMACKAVRPVAMIDPQDTSESSPVATAEEVRAQAAIVEALEEWRGRGLRVTFPSRNTWHMAHGKREDSGHTSLPLLDVVRCAKEIMR